MDTIWTIALLVSISYLLYLILRHRKSRREIGKGLTRTTVDTVYTFSKGVAKTMYKASKSAFKEEYKSRKQRNKR